MIKKAEPFLKKSLTNDYSLIYPEAALMKPPKQKVSITLGEEVIRAIQILAQEED